jgi:hypothetical protein
MKIRSEAFGTLARQPMQPSAFAPLASSNWTSSFLWLAATECQQTQIEKRRTGLAIREQQSNFYLCLTHLLVQNNGCFGSRAGFEEH